MIVFALATGLSAYGLWIHFFAGGFKAYTQRVWDAKAAYLLWGYAVASGTVIGFVCAASARFGSLRQLLFAGSFLLSLFFLFVSASRGALVGARLACALLTAVMPLPAPVAGGLEVSRAQLLAGLFAAGTLAFALCAFFAQLEFETINRFRSLLREAANPETILQPNRFRYYEQAVELFFALSHDRGRARRLQPLYQGPGAQRHRTPQLAPESSFSPRAGEGRGGAAPLAPAIGRGCVRFWGFF